MSSTRTHLPRALATDGIAVDVMERTVATTTTRSSSGSTIVSRRVKDAPTSRAVALKFAKQSLEEDARAV